MFKRLSVMVALVAMVAGACGDDDAGGSSETQVVVIALTEQIQADSDAGEPFDGDTESQCLADGLVSSLGLARLEELGVTSDDVTSQEAFFGAMTDDELGEAVDVAFDCVDFEAVFAAEFTTMSEGSASCFAGRLMDSGYLKMATASELRGESFDPSADPEAMGQITLAAEACLTDEELAEFYGS